MNEDFEKRLEAVIREFMAKPGMLELFKKTSWFGSNQRCHGPCGCLDGG